jgi:peptide/nickel transport system ATP-binding protein
MYQGRIVEHGPVGEVFTQPRHDYTRALLEAAPGRGWTFGAGGAHTLPPAGVPAGGTA